MAPAPWLNALWKQLSQQEQAHTLRARSRDSQSVFIQGWVFLSSFISPQVSRLQVCVKISCWQEETSPPETLGPFTWGRTPIKELWASLKLNLGKIPPQSSYLTFTRWQMLSFSGHLKKLLSQVCQVFPDPVKILHSKKKYVLASEKHEPFLVGKCHSFQCTKHCNIERNARMNDTVLVFKLLIVQNHNISNNEDMNE